MERTASMHTLFNAKQDSTWIYNFARKTRSTSKLGLDKIMFFRDGNVKREAESSLSDSFI